ARMAPTYRLQLGAAGSSSAIDVARRVGLPEAICVRATELAKNAGGALAQALVAANAERDRAERERDAHAAAARAAEEELAKIREERAAFERTRRHEELKFREALRAELEFARAQLRELSETLRKQSSHKVVDKATEDLAVRIHEQAQAERAVRDALAGPLAAGPVKIEPGARVKLARLDAVVEILERDGDEVVVSAGSLKMRARVDELLPVGNARGAPKRELKSAQDKQADHLARAAASAAKPFSVASPKVDVRGKRAEEALRELEQTLDRATRQGEGFVLVVHGHGTGALKAVMREYLDRSPYAAAHRPGESHEGGDGVTVVSLA
ncbi:MAG: Smr/MutS family protein, partial [Myxococcaceae bacterium]|nr:Smr/MutS family protein [Myxococcaceae bacterium]